MIMKGKTMAGGQPKGSKSNKKKHTVAKRVARKFPPKKYDHEPEATEDDVGNDLQSDEERTEDVLEYFKDEEFSPMDKVHAQRMVVAHLFVNVHGCKSDGWHGKEGITNQIREHLGLGKWSDVETTLNKILQCKIDKIAHTGSIHCNKVGRRAIISLDSEVAQMIVGCIKDGLSLATTTQTVNQHCEAMDQDAITESAVYTAFCSLKPKMIPVS
jgi:hypothetical protein